ncbi:MAG: hypothetical protein A2096_10915 [Spirochaetes bacterium GWF1_41_5]|nr:MAG: hypothetical protein A2096_10915 [Spirochaetes bacterium GWF1_41_5]HBE01665.1 hypothetical protein [Spirochaetia bacterium]
MQPEIKFFSEQKTVLITPVCDITVDSIESLNESLLKVKTHNLLFYIFDMQNVDYICSAGLGVIAHLLRDIENSGIRIYLCSLHDTLKKMFELTRLNEFAVIKQNYNECIEDINKKHD